MYDVVVAGGSIAGLCCAREAALGGCSVLVIEDDAEVGTPDHCGGMVSVSALLQVTLELKCQATRYTAKIFLQAALSLLHPQILYTQFLQNLCVFHPECALHILF